ncbi:MAG: RNA polymerase sigma factor [Chitinophagaceae bacterium]|nr:RNA polymerase sigma factor [Chitinophagaceae bacterium]
MSNRPDLLHIIQGCVKAKRDSQKQFYQLFYGYSMGICMRYCASPDDAEEIVHDGFLKIYRALHSFNPKYADIEASLKGWMKRILINTAIDHLRKNRQHFLVAEIFDNHFNIADETETAIDRMTHKEILDVVDQLSPVYKTVFNLFVIDGYKHEEIADQLNISVGASKSNLSKARANIKKMLQDAEQKYYEQKII